MFLPCFISSDVFYRKKSGKKWLFLYNVHFQTALWPRISPLFSLIVLDRLHSQFFASVVLIWYRIQDSRLLISTIYEVLTDLVKCSTIFIYPPSKKNNYFWTTGSLKNVSSMLESSRNLLIRSVKLEDLK